MHESLHCHICVLQFKLLYFYCLFKMFSEVKLSMQSIILKFTLWNATFEVFETLPPNHLFGKHNVCSYDKVRGTAQGSLRRHYSTLWCMFCYVWERKWGTEYHEMKCLKFMNKLREWIKLRANIYCREIKCGFKKDLLIGLEGNKRKNEALSFVN